MRVQRKRPRDIVLDQWRRMLAEDAKLQDAREVHEAKPSSGGPPEPGLRPDGSPSVGRGAGWSDHAQVLDQVASQDSRTSTARRNWNKQETRQSVLQKESGEDVAERYARNLGVRTQAPTQGILETLAQVRKDRVRSSRTVAKKSRSAAGSFSSIPHPGAWRAKPIAVASQVGPNPAVMSRSSASPDLRGTVEIG